MALDRWIALVLLFVFLLYGYTAFFAMDDALPPIMRRTPIWPSSFPKVLAIGAILITLAILLGLEKSEEKKTPDIDLTRPGDYKIGQALALIGLMVAYAFLLRPLGFLASTFLFLAIGSFILGERRYVTMAIVSAAAAGGVWFLVDNVLGIFLSPLPSFIMAGVLTGGVHA